MTKHIPILLCIIALAGCGTTPEFTDINWKRPDLESKTHQLTPAEACASGRGTILSPNVAACQDMPVDAPSAACGPDWGPCQRNPSPAQCGSLNEFYVTEPAPCAIPPAGYLFGCGTLGPAIGVMDPSCGGFYRIPCPATLTPGNPYTCRGGSVASLDGLHAGVLCCRGGLP